MEWRRLLARDPLFIVLADAMAVDDDQLRGFVACLMGNMVEESYDSVV